MDENTALRFVQAFRQEIEAITLQAKVSVKRGIGIMGDPDVDHEAYSKLDMFVNIVHFSGWPTSKNRSAKFVFGEVPLSSPLLSLLNGGCLNVPWTEISRLPHFVCKMVACVLDGQHFKVRVTPTEQELVAAAIQCSDKAIKNGDDLGKWDFLSDWGLEAWNGLGAVPILLLGSTLEEVFKEEILDRLKRAVSQK
jgi:hypothetical protein